MTSRGIFQPDVPRGTGSRGRQSRSVATRWEGTGAGARGRGRQERPCGGVSRGAGWWQGSRGGSLGPERCRGSEPHCERHQNHQPRGQLLQTPWHRLSNLGIVLFAPCCWTWKPHGRSSKGKDKACSAGGQFVCGLSAAPALAWGHETLAGNSARVFAGTRCVTSTWRAG